LRSIGSSHFSQSSVYSIRLIAAAFGFTRMTTVYKPSAGLSMIGKQLGRPHQAT
jgi:hypothetical protein